MRRRLEKTLNTSEFHFVNIESDKLNAHGRMLTQTTQCQNDFSSPLIAARFKRLIGLAIKFFQYQSYLKKFRFSSHLLKPNVQRRKKFRIIIHPTIWGGRTNPLPHVEPSRRRTLDSEHPVQSSFGVASHQLKGFKFGAKPWFLLII